MGTALALDVCSLTYVALLNNSNTNDSSCQTARLRRRRVNDVISGVAVLLPGQQHQLARLPGLAYRDSLVVPVCNCLTSFFAGFVIFGIIGFMAHEMSIGVGEVATGGQ